MINFVMPIDPSVRVISPWQAEHAGFVRGWAPIEMNMHLEIWSHKEQHFLHTFHEKLADMIIDPCSRCRELFNGPPELEPSSGKNNSIGMWQGYQCSPGGNP